MRGKRWLSLALALCLTLGGVHLPARAAVLIARLGRDEVQLAAWAKEGLINQHTARKALEQYAANLK